MQANRKENFNPDTSETDEIVVSTRNDLDPINELICSNCLLYVNCFNKRLGINVKVEVRGRKGVITGYTRRWIFVRTDDNCDVLVNMRRWEVEQWVIVDPYKMT